MAARQQQIILWGVALGAIALLSLLVLAYWHQIPRLDQGNLPATKSELQNISVKIMSCWAETQNIPNSNKSH